MPITLVKIIVGVIVDVHHRILVRVLAGEVVNNALKRPYSLKWIL